MYSHLTKTLYPYSQAFINSTVSAFLKGCLTMLQELEALRIQVQSQLAEINQMKTERQELLRRSEAAAVNVLQI